MSDSFSVDLTITTNMLTKSVWIYFSLQAESQDSDTDTIHDVWTRLPSKLTDQQTKNVFLFSFFASS